MNTKETLPSGLDNTSGAMALLNQLDSLYGDFAAYLKYKQTGVEDSKSKVLLDMPDIDRDSLFAMMMEITAKSDKIKMFNTILANSSVAPEDKQKKPDAKVKNIQHLAQEKQKA